MCLMMLETLYLQYFSLFKSKKIQPFEPNKISCETWSNSNMSCESYLPMCSSLSVTELGTPDAHMSRATHPHTPGAPTVIFSSAPGDVTDLLWPAHSFPSVQSAVRASDLHSLQLRFCLHLLLVHNYCSAAVCSNCSFCRDWWEAGDCDG